MNLFLIIDTIVNFIDLMSLLPYDDLNNFIIDLEPISSCSYSFDTIELYYRVRKDYDAYCETMSKEDRLVNKALMYSIERVFASFKWKKNGLAYTNIPLQVSTENSAGHDIKSSVDIILAPGKVTMVETGVKYFIPEGVLKIESRSGYASRGIVAVGGVCDSDYRGSIKVLLLNTTDIPFKITAGERIAQALLYITHQFMNADVQKKTRGEGGFGSTGY
jgi:dUTP pyrophosphatase